MNKLVWDIMIAVTVGALGAFGTYVLVPQGKPWFIVVVFLLWASVSYIAGTKR